jgi:hypothetical protein
MNHSTTKHELQDLIRVTIVLGNVLMRRKFELRSLHVFMGLKARVVETSRRVDELQPHGKAFESLVNSIDKMTVNEFHFNFLQSGLARIFRTNGKVMLPFFGL